MFLWHYAEYFKSIGFIHIFDFSIEYTKIDCFVLFFVCLCLCMFPSKKKKKTCGENPDRLISALEITFVD